nr:pilus assembly protein PilP [Azomonas macrocytogenes]
MMVLGGCDRDGDFPDLKSYMAEIQAKPKGTIEPLPVFPPYEAFTYNASGLRSPFLPPEKAELARKQRGSKEIRPDDGRVKQFLEGFNIDDFSMVGTLANQVGVYALIRGAGGVHRVKVGDYLGRNHGRIIAIDGIRVDVVEIVPDGEGGWLERPHTLLLKEHS